MTRTIDLPNLGSLYAGAALDAVKSKVISSGSLRGTSVEPVAAQHPGIPASQAEDYRQLFGGEVLDGAYRRSLPSVLVHIAAFPVQMGLMSGRDFPLPLMGMVHLRNAAVHHKPVAPGQPLQIVAKAANFRPHRKGTQVDITVEIFPGGGDLQSMTSSEVLWSGTSTYLGIGTLVAGKPGGDQASRGHRAFSPPKKTAQWSLGPRTGREYAAVSGDYNPIHLSSLAAKALGQPGVIVHGMYAAGRMLEGREPEGAGHRWSIEFEAPIVLPATVAFGVENTSHSTRRFTGWNPRKHRRHFTGELSLPD